MYYRTYAEQSHAEYARGVFHFIRTLLAIGPGPSRLEVFEDG